MVMKQSQTVRAGLLQLRLGRAIAPALLIITLLAFVPQPTHAFDASHLPVTLADTLAALPATAEVITARSAYESARLEAVAAGYRGDLLFSLSPTWKQSWLSDSDLDPYHELSLTAAATVPLGLSSADRARLDRAVQRLRIAEADLRAITLDTASALAAAWLKVQISAREIAVLDVEASALRMQLNADETLFRAGELSLGELLRSRDTTHRADLAAENGRIRADSAALDLLLRAGFPIQTELASRLIGEAEGSAPIPLVLPPMTAPHPADVAAKLRQDAYSPTGTDGQRHPRIVRQDALIRIALTDTAVSRDPLLSTVRMALSSDGHSGSIVYSFPRPSLSLGYTPPAYGIGSPLPSGSGRDSTDQNSLTLSAVFSLAVGSSKDQSVAAATVAATQEMNRLDGLLRSLETELSARFRQIPAAEAAVELAYQARARAEATQEAIAARSRLGMATEAESAVAAASVARAQLNVIDAEAAVWSATLSYLAAAYRPDSLPLDFHKILSGGSSDE
ncbi:MAG: hypothetical protein EA403_01685 [Spirochaetaceae bacterium]|nr:MAG: hypothetical protein EA403_01685 [Spirochaetaceae bacterium]